MPTIDQVRKKKKALEQSIMKAVNNFELDGVMIDYISLERDYERDDELRPSTNPMDGNAPIVGVKVSLTIDLD